PATVLPSHTRGGAEDGATRNRPRAAAPPPVGPRPLRIAGRGGAGLTRAMESSDGDPGFRDAGPPLSRGAIGGRSRATVTLAQPTVISARGCCSTAHEAGD